MRKRKMKNNNGHAEFVAKLKAMVECYWNVYPYSSFRSTDEDTVLSGVHALKGMYKKLQADYKTLQAEHRITLAALVDEKHRNTVTLSESIVRRKA